MRKQLNKANGATEQLRANSWVYQNMESIGAPKFTAELVNELKIRKGEVLTMDELETVYGMINHPDYGSYVNGLLNNSIQDDEFGVIQPLLDFLHQKRFFIFKDSEGVARVIGIPSERIIGKGFCSFSKGLLACAVAYKNYCESVEKSSSYKNFESRVFAIQKAIAGRLFSKKFKDKLDFSFKGLSGVALTGNLSLDGVALPKWYCEKHNLKIGDLVMVTRDPIQNIVMCLRVEGYTKNEIRVNSHMFTFLGGDFDGDRVNIIPFISIKAELVKRGFDGVIIGTVLYELVKLIPKHMFKQSKFSRLLRDLEWIEPAKASISSEDIDINFLLSATGKKLVGAPLYNRLQKYANDFSIVVIHNDKEFTPVTK
ncbi:MAG: hypothetical protein ACRCXX_14020 [Cetobacterium sp.]|uniref:hypothetical protein n=1 Tax=Cetobacterium sp. TaxID=2071632 RepID=UPI003F3AA307